MIRTIGSLQYTKDCDILTNLKHCLQIANYANLNLAGHRINNWQQNNHILTILSKYPIIKIPFNYIGISNTDQYIKSLQDKIKTDSALNKNNRVAKALIHKEKQATSILGKWLCTSKESVREISYPIIKQLIITYAKILRQRIFTA